MDGQAGIRIAVITGSVRPGNQTSMAAAIVMDELERLGDVTAVLIDPVSWRLPPPGAPGGSDSVRKLQEEIGGCTGLVLATPEYHGSFSSVMKLIIENLGFPSVLAGKPISLLGVAGGAIGAVKSLEHLRSVCSHIGAIVLPGPVSVSNSKKVFAEDGRCLDERIEKRIRALAAGLKEYIRRSICPNLILERMVREGGDPG